MNWSDLRATLRDRAGLAADGEQQVVEIGSGRTEVRAALFFVGAALEIGEHAFDDGVDQWHSGLRVPDGARGAGE